MFSSLTIILVFYFIIMFVRSLSLCSDKEVEEEKIGFHRNGFNQFRSDRIPLDREVPDTRDPR